MALSNNRQHPSSGTKHSTCLRIVAESHGELFLEVGFLYHSNITQIATVAISSSSSVGRT